VSALAQSGLGWPRLARYAPAMGRYVEPFVTGAGIAIGGTFLGTLLEGLRLSAPEAALALGAGALAGTLTAWGSNPRRAPGLARPSPRPSPRPRADEGVVCARCQNTVPAHEWAEIVRRAWHTTSSVPRSHRAGLAASSNGPGEEIWGQWAPEEPGRLPVDLVGPVPETAWFPPAPGAPVPFPDREPAWFVVDGELLSAPLAPTLPGVPAPDQLSTTEVPLVADFLTALEPAPTFPPGALSDLTVIPTVAEGFGPELEYDWITAEALHPIPPHLRAAPPKPPKKVHARAPAKPKSCASCSQVLAPRSRTRPCPECHQPLCHTCLTQAVVDHGHTWCQTCAATRQWGDPIADRRWTAENRSDVGEPALVRGPAPAN
jgi:hypothetical protein